MELLGSSPLARGLLAEVDEATMQERIIPARAGFTHGPGNAPGPSWDHPRSRGVYIVSAAMTATMMGSSPLARGLRYSIDRNRDDYGIIPARAGFTVQAEERGHIL